MRRCLTSIDENQPEYQIRVDCTDYPKAEDESNIFLTGADVLVTVAGNQKFANRDKIEIEQPICNGLLGHRLLIINKQNQVKFQQTSTIEQLRNYTVGVPATWADADLFRHNQFRVDEQGSLEDMLQLIAEGVVDFATLGANEIEAVFHQYASSTATLAIENSMLIYYPLPLIFYVNPVKPILADHLRSGLKRLIANGGLHSIFNSSHAGIVERLALPSRKHICLENPYLPEYLKQFRPALW